MRPWFSLREVHTTYNYLISDSDLMFRPKAVCDEMNRSCVVFDSLMMLDDEKICSLFDTCVFDVNKSGNVIFHSAHQREDNIHLQILPLTCSSTRGGYPDRLGAS